MNENELDLTLRAIGRSHVRNVAPPSLHELTRSVALQPAGRERFVPPFTGRFQSMFSATKFVVAGVIVALFGGFLLAGVLTTQPSEESRPAVGASATAQAEPSEVASEQTTRSDLLPGVDLKVEVMRPGVYRVLSDGEHDLRNNVWTVAVTPNGEVWVEKHRIAGYGGPGVDPGDTRIRDGRILRLGDPEKYLATSDGDWSLGVVEGVVRADAGNRGREWDGQGWRRMETDDICGWKGPDGASWLNEEMVRWCSGLPDDLRSEWMIVRVTADGTPQGFSRVDIGLGDDVGLDDDGLSGEFFAFGDGGTVWAALFEDDGAFVGLAAYDGEQWSFIESEPLPGDRVHQQLAVAPDGTVWIVWDTGRGELTGVSWDGESWGTFGPVSSVWAGPDIGFAPDGRVWFDPVTFVDGRSLRQLQIPASASNDDPRIQTFSYAPDASIWMTVVDMRTPKELGCQQNPDVCDGATDGLYVITPEGAMATE
jgi:hypothetical protein